MLEIKMGLAMCKASTVTILIYIWLLSFSYHYQCWACTSSHWELAQRPEDSHLIILGTDHFLAQQWGSLLNGITTSFFQSSLSITSYILKCLDKRIISFLLFLVVRDKLFNFLNLHLSHFTFKLLFFANLPLVSAPPYSSRMDYHGHQCALLGGSGLVNMFPT